MKADFSGYATKANLQCSDGRTILAHAFKDQNGQKVPLVWSHDYSSPDKVLGHALLENREDGVYAYAFFNKSETAKIAKELVLHGDINSMSIRANKLKQKGPMVVHGVINEVSLVLAGANPGALIDNVSIEHSDGQLKENESEAIIYTGLYLEHEDSSDDQKEDKNMADKNDEKTVQEIYDSLNPEQKDVVHYMIGLALEEGEDADGDDAEHDDLDDENEEVLKHSDQEGNEMTRNVFDQNEKSASKATLTHDQLQTIVKDAKKLGSFKEAFLQHAEEYGIDNIDVLFPDAKATSTSPELLKRQTEWVQEVIGGTKHSPFAKIKTIVADITAEEARARGYVTGNLKKDEIIELLKRTTDPQTVYKKQKLDRDDMIDITDLDVVAWLKQEMRLMLNEEIARAVLIGDGRSSGDEDKIREDRIRPIAKDDDMYAHKVVIPSNASVNDKIEALIRGRAHFRGSGSPTFFTTLPNLTDFLLEKDKVGRRLYESQAALADALMAKKIVDVEVMETVPNLVGIYVNLQDYTIGANKGGEVSMFDDFDIDYNQYKYLLETRVSGALTRPKAAVVVSTQEGDPATPVSPSFNGGTNTITIPTTTGIIYQIDGETVSGSVVIEEDTQVDAIADEGYYIPAGVTKSWTFVYTDQG